MKLADIDPSKLIFESYRIDGISAVECRAIFFDWAVKLPAQYDQRAAIRFLVGIYADAVPDHPMSVIMQEALADSGTSRRRGGRAGRPATKT